MSSGKWGANEARRWRSLNPWHDMRANKAGLFSWSCSARARTSASVVIALAQGEGLDIAVLIGFRSGANNNKRRGNSAGLQRYLLGVRRAS